MALSRNTPENIARTLRQQAGFGCALCGSPFVEYHHIDEWKNEQHFDTDRMVAVCPSCHNRFHRMTRAKQLEIKRKPINISKGVVRGFLEFNVSLSSILVGSNTFNDCPNLIGYEDELLLGWRVMNGEYVLTIHIYGKSGKELLHVVDNEIIFMAKDFWDVKFKYNFMEIKSNGGAHVIRIDLRNFPGTLIFKSFIAGCEVSVSRAGIIVSQGFNSFSKCTFNGYSGFCLHFFSEPWRSAITRPLDYAIGYTPTFPYGSWRPMETAAARDWWPNASFSPARPPR